MNTTNPDELFEHISQFLKKKGVDLQEGAYTRTIQKGCQVLADTINLSQQAMERAKSEVEKKLEQVREVIHQKTAPQPPPASAHSEPASTAGRAGPKSKRASKARAPQLKRRKPGKHG